MELCIRFAVEFSPRTQIALERVSAASTPLEERPLTSGSRVNSPWRDCPFVSAGQGSGSTGPMVPLEEHAAIATTLMEILMDQEQTIKNCPWWKRARCSKPQRRDSKNCTDREAVGWRPWRLRSTKPRATFAVRPGQLVEWLSSRSEGETIGVTALKRRVQELVRKPRVGKHTGP